jgi:organic hydroperoxide reductase OsmC/OhrA
MDVIVALEGIDAAQLQEIAQETKARCPISMALEGDIGHHGDVAKPR